LVVVIGGGGRWWTAMGPISV